MTTHAVQLPELPRSLPPPRTKRGFRRLLVMVVKAFGLTIVFVVAAAGGVLIHAGMRAPRELARLRLNDVLATTFKGKIILHRVGELRLDGVSDVDAELLDPEGNRALFVRGADARLRTLGLIRSLFTDQLEIGLTDVRVASAEVVLVERAAGELGLARAFELAQPSTDSSSTGTTRVEVDEIALGHVWVHGAVGGVESIDADVDDVAGSLTVTPETDVLIRVSRAHIEARSVHGVPLSGDLVGSLGLLHDGLFDATARLDGTAGAAVLHVDASMVRERVDATVTLDAPSVESFRAFLPDDLLLRGPVHARIEASGPLSHLDGEVEARLGAATLSVSGYAELPTGDASTWSAAARVTASRVDLAELVKDAPGSDLAATLNAAITFDEGGRLGGRFALALAPGVVEGQRIPSASLAGSFTQRAAVARGFVDERGAPTEVSLVVDAPPHDAAPRVTFHTNTNVRDLRRVERVGAIGSGRVRLTTNGALDLEGQTLDASARADVVGLSVSGVALGGARIDATASGPLRQLKLGAIVHGSALQVAGLAFDSVALSARGTPTSLDVSTGLTGSATTPAIEARAHLGVSEDGALSVSGGRIQLERGETTVVATVPWVSVRDGGVHANGVSIEGLGEPMKVSLDVQGSSIGIRASAPNLDLARVKELLAREEDIRGHVSFEVDGRFGPAGGQGHVHLHAVAVQLGIGIPATANVDARLEGRSVDGTVDLDAPKLGAVKVVLASFTPAGALTDAGAWSRATGRVDVTGALDLQKLSDLLPDSARATIGTSTGELRVNATVSRATGDKLPSVVVELATRKLSVRGPERRDALIEGTLTAGPPPFRLDGLDVIVGGTLDGATGRADVKTLLRDASGDLAFADVSTADVSRLMTGANPLATIPLDAHIEVAKMPLDRLPLPKSAVPVMGDVAFTADFEGPIARPRGALHLEATDLRARSSRRCERPLSVVVDGSYDGARGDVALVATTGGRAVLNAEATVDVDVAALGDETPPAWAASGKVELARFPLDALDGFMSTRLAGEVTGAVKVDGLHEDARLEAHFEGDDVEVDGGKIPDASIDATIGGGEIAATAKLAQADGDLNLTATGAMAWGASVAPTLDVAKDVEVDLDAKNFSLKPFAPFLEGVVSDLDGRLDADAKIHVRQGGKDGDVDGSVVVRDGVFDVPQIGERFHDVKAKIVMHPWGTVRLEEFSAAAPTGKVTGEASAVLKGISLERADAKVTIAKGESVPIVIEGVPFGSAYGTVTAKVQSSEDGERLDVALKVPTLHVQLPRSIGHSVQALEPNEDVRVGFHDTSSGGAHFVAVPLSKPTAQRREPDATNVVMVIDLGDDIGIRRDTTLDVVIQGRVKVDIAGETKVTGQIRLTRGRLELEGRIFTVDRGLVSFTGGDPSNPYIQAMAHWDSPTKTRVYAEFSGTPTSGKLTLRSEPALSQDEILSLVLTGTSNGQIGASAPPGQDGGAGVQAVGLAGGVVTEGLNKIISGFTSRLSTRIDSSDANNPQPQIVVQLSKSISASLGYKLGVPAPGDNPDRAELTVDWRFINNWSLTAAVGDQGSTALDVEWRYHY